MALISTTNENRNYYYGLEALFFTTASIAMPILGGMLIAMATKYNWFWNHPNGAYFVLTALVIVLTVLAGLTITKGDFKQPAIAKFVYFRFHRLWRKMLLMAGLKGLAQGFIIAAPVMLIMRLVGNEATMGSIQSLGAGLSAILLYLLGRFAKPQHRLKIYSFGLLLFFTGSLFNGFLYSAAGAIIFVGCLIFARPLLDLAYFPIQLGVIECVSTIEKRSHFTYLFSHEVGLYLGRVVGCLLFVFSATQISEDWALRYALLIIAILQMLSLLVVKSITADPEWCESKMKGSLQTPALKEPTELTPL